MLVFVYSVASGKMIRVTDNLRGVDWTDPKKKVIGRQEIETFEQALEIANEGSRLLRKPLLACDNGNGIWPRYDVILAPQVGDDVSKAFNGDSYPCGKITKISKSYKRIETDKGIKFFRRRESDGWYEGGRGGFAMVMGIHNERSREF